LIVAVTVVPAVGAAVAFVVPGNDTLGLLLGWVLVAIGCDTVLRPRFGRLHNNTDGH
jgi:hypothetical protein